jgi:hypothetical protein
MNRFFASPITVTTFLVSFIGEGVLSGIAHKKEREIIKKDMWKLEYRFMELDEKLYEANRSIEALQAANKQNKQQNV